MNDMIKAVQIVGKLNECRNTAKALSGANYAARVEPYKANVRRLMESSGLEALQCAQTLMARASAIGIMWYSAALLDITEETTPKKDE